MITRIEANCYRYLRSVNQPLGPLQILVGPNASGKSVFLDVLAFLATLAADGVEAAVHERTENFYDLVWRHGSSFELAIEAAVPAARQLVPGRGLRQESIRYEVGVRIDASTDAPFFTKESLIAYGSGLDNGVQVQIERNAHQTQVYNPGSGSLEPRNPGNRTALSCLSRDESSLPAAVWLLELLSEHIHHVVLDPKELRKPSPPVQPKMRNLDGSQLGRFVAQLAENQERFQAWIAHLRTALPDLDTIRTVLRPEDRKRYVVIRYQNGFEAPSWVLSDGTLRLLALTVLAYLPGLEGVYLIEEPENGIHPRAIETFYQSLSSVYHGQVLITSHSPLLLEMASPEEILCFLGTPEGAVIVRGSDHPALRDWRGEVALSDLFAGGVFG